MNFCYTEGRFLGCMNTHIARRYCTTGLDTGHWTLDHSQAQANASKLLLIFKKRSPMRRGSGGFKKNGPITENCSTSSTQLPRTSMMRMNCKHFTNSSLAHLYMMLTNENIIKVALPSPGKLTCDVMAQLKTRDKSSVSIKQFVMIWYVSKVCLHIRFPFHDSRAIKQLIF